DEATRMRVNGSENATFSSGCFSAHSSGAAARVDKNIANRPAKNMSSLESHTIVPTLVMFGRLSECIWLLARAGAAVTRSLSLPAVPKGRGGGYRPPERGGRSGKQR